MAKTYLLDEHGLLGHCSLCHEKLFIPFRRFVPGQTWAIARCEVCCTETILSNDGDECVECSRKKQQAAVAAERAFDRQIALAHLALLAQQRQQPQIPHGMVACSYCGALKSKAHRFCPSCRLDWIGCPADRGGYNFFGNGFGG